MVSIVAKNARVTHLVHVIFQSKGSNIYDKRREMNMKRDSACIGEHPLCRQKQQTEAAKMCVTCLVLWMKEKNHGKEDCMSCMQVQRWSSVCRKESETWSEK